MSEVTIKTNEHPREILSWYELTPKEKKELNYRTDQEWEEYGGSFFRYKGNIYDLGEFMRTEGLGDNFKGWDGYSSDSYFSGVLVKYDQDCEYVIAGTYFS